MSKRLEDKSAGGCRQIVGLSTELCLGLLVVFYLGCLSILLPSVVVGRTAIGLEDVLGAMGLPLALIVVGAMARVPDGRSDQMIHVFWVLVIAFGGFAGVLQSFYYMDSVSLPTEMFQYVKRYTFFWCAYGIGCFCSRSRDGASGALLVCCGVAVLIGLWQVFRLPGFEMLSSIYTRTEAQFVGLVDRYEISRVIGVAGHSTAWGGFSVFVTAVSCVFIFGKFRLGVVRLRLVGIAVFLCALINVVYSGSRVALVAFMCVVLLIAARPFFGVRGKAGMRFRARDVYMVVLLLIGVVGAGMALFSVRGDFVIFRFASLLESFDSGVGRFSQVRAGLGYLNGFLEWMFGVGNKASRADVVSHGIEVEPIYLLVNYGVVGVILRYGLVALILNRCLNLARGTNINCRAVGIGATMAIVGYMVFSLGYFFFQELVVGVPVWLLLGLACGIRARVG